MISLLFFLAGCFMFFGGRFAWHGRHAVLQHLRPSIKGQIGRAEALIGQMEGRPAPVARTQPKPVLGATPAHYRAFSLLEVRVQTLAAREALIAFRSRAKTIKLERDETIRNEAVSIMNTFATFAESYAPLHDRTHIPGELATDGIEAKLIAAVGRLDGALRSLLESGRVVGDDRRLEEMSRYIEIRYQPEAANPLSPIEDARHAPIDLVGFRPGMSC